MPENNPLETFLDKCTVDPAVFVLRPDYRALLLVVDGLSPDSTGEGNSSVDALVAAAETHAREQLANAPVDDEVLQVAGDALVEALKSLGDDVRVWKRLVAA